MSIIINLIINYPYILCCMLMCISLFIILISDNLIKKVLGLSMFQSSIILFYLLIGKIMQGKPPIIKDTTDIILSNPTPHVLMLTAIVVSVAINALAFALIYKIYKIYNTVNYTQLLNKMTIHNED